MPSTHKFSNACLPLEGELVAYSDGNYLFGFNTEPDLRSPNIGIVCSINPDNDNVLVENGGSREWFEPEELCTLPGTLPGQLVYPAPNQWVAREDCQPFPETESVNNGCGLYELRIFRAFLYLRLDGDWIKQLYVQYSFGAYSRFHHACDVVRVESPKDEPKDEPKEERTPWPCHDERPIDGAKALDITKRMFR